MDLELDEPLIESSVEVESEEDELDVLTYRGLFAGLRRFFVSF